MEKEINTLAHDGDYNGAKDMRSRLNNLKKEFEALQTSAMALQRDDQWHHFDTASNLLKKQTGGPDARFYFSL